MLTYEEIRQLVILVFWLIVSCRFLSSVVNVICKKLQFRIETAEYKIRNERTKVEAKEEPAVKKPYNDSVIGFKSRA